MSGSFCVGRAAAFALSLTLQADPSSEVSRASVVIDIGSQKSKKIRCTYCVLQVHCMFLRVLLVMLWGREALLLRPNLGNGEIINYLH